jgi:hypothetical protein
MDAQEIIRQFQDWLKREKRIDLNLEILEEKILEYSLQGLSYSMMSDRIDNYDLFYISNIKAPKLWRNLRQFTGLDINKKNCKVIIENILTSEQPQVFKQITKNLSRINLREAPDFNIKSVHNGKIEKVLDSTFFLDNVLMDLLDNQIFSLSDLQQNIIRKLATEKEPKTIFQIYQYFPDYSQGGISDAINNLWKIGIMEKDDILEEKILWVINPLIQKYIKRRY